ncbi:hypothetical protein [Methanoplanus limicola]|uniref:hypothetical protein n=1 Tax=Methanoplanus limicola TaxID=2315 RepID=UPI0012F65392|nr:hypothetical protein [Methanoplanus limicola]
MQSSKYTLFDFLCYGHRSFFPVIILTFEFQYRLEEGLNLVKCRICGEEKEKYLRVNHREFYGAIVICGECYKKEEKKITGFSSCGCCGL